MAWTLGLIVVDGLLVAGAVALFWWAATASWPRWSRLAFIPLGGFLVGVLVFTVILVPQLDEERDLPDCDSFVFREADWRARDDVRRLATAWGIARCGTFTDASRSTVERRLGKPGTEGSIGEQSYLSYEGLDLILLGDRVVEAEAGYGGG